MSKSLFSIAAICLFAVPSIGEASLIYVDFDSQYDIETDTSSDSESATAKPPTDPKPPRLQFPPLFDKENVDLSHSTGVSDPTPSGGSSSSLTWAIPVGRFAAQPPLLAWRLGDASLLPSGPDLEGISPVPRS